MRNFVGLLFVLAIVLTLTNGAPKSHGSHSKSVSSSVERPHKKHSHPHSKSKSNGHSHEKKTTVPTTEGTAVPEENLVLLNKQKPVLDNAPVPEVDISPTIIGGSRASRGTYGHQAALNIDGAYFCGGSLISFQWILTAAHCADGAFTFKVMLGSVDRSLFDSFRVDMTSTTASVHSGYNPSTLVNDVAVIRLPSSVTLNTYIKVIRCPRLSESSLSYSGFTATATGFGLTSDSASSISRYLMAVSLSVISNSACAQYFGSTIVSSTICTSGSGIKGTCSGDSGGPLVIRESDGVLTLIGVVSFGPTSCELGYPSGYARVTSFQPWITSKTGITFRS